jgi:hypothetical protein
VSAQAGARGGAGHARRQREGVIPCVADADDVFYDSGRRIYVSGEGVPRRVRRLGPTTCASRMWRRR